LAIRWVLPGAGFSAARQQTVAAVIENVLTGQVLMEH
jgi:hypothetical protein